MSDAVGTGARPGAAAAVAPVEVRALAAAAWRFRRRVEREAEARFARLAARLDAIGAAPELVQRAFRASGDEHRHADRCGERTLALGARVTDDGPAAPAEIAPAGLSLADRVLYEVVAACCISETESMAVLSTLLDAADDPALRQTLRELAADEIRHARLGWAHLAMVHGRDPARTEFLAPLLPAMLGGSIDPALFDPGAPEEEHPALLALGILPRSLQREVFTGTLESVILPGLERCGVDTGAARAWLAARQDGPG